MKNKILAIICVFIIFTQQVSASVLGEEILGWSHDIAKGTEIYKNVYMSEQDGVGQQVEYYAKYTPNDDVVPMVVSGDKLWGFNKISEIEKYMKDNDLVPVLGINASYYSLKTGIPMGHVISDRKILSKDNETYQSIGFLPDGSGFIAPLSIKTTLYYEENEVDIGHINKYNQETIDFITLYTPEFGEDTHNDVMSLNLILGEVDGELSLGEELTAVVEEKFTYQGAIKIPEDKIILTINEISNPELYEALSSLEIGETVNIYSEANEEYEWESVDSALGSVGETLIKDGEIQDDFPTGTAPRTAVGITEDGEIVFYVIDGRQKPYSYGVKVETLANRMKELGCVDAINLDGGGSTIISGVYPGSDVSSILNSPSDGKPRGVSNYIFLKNTQEPTEKAEKLYLYPFEEHYLSGYTDILTPKAVDSEYYPAKLPKKLKFSVDGTESIIDNNGVLIAMGDGKFTVNVTGDRAKGIASYNVYSTPTNIDVLDSETGKTINKLSLKKNDRIKLDLKSQYGLIDLKSNLDCYRIIVPEEIGYIEDNELIITAEMGEGVLLISAGEYTKEIPISVKRDNPFYDTDNHWAKEQIKKAYKAGIVSGVVLDGKPMFLPDNNITREELAVILCKCFHWTLPPENIEYDLSVFSDEYQISDWARPYVGALYTSGYLNGKPNGDEIMFAPKDYLTRAEMMTVLGRVLEMHLDDDEEFDELTFDDSEDIPDWAIDYVKIVVNEGYVKGYEDNTIRPNNNISRAEAATIISSMFAG